MRTIAVATGNRHKLREMSAILAPHGIRLLAAAEIGGMPEFEEDGHTFAENAAKKARETATARRAWVLADDSGLAVDALGGAPGIHSARYAGVGGNDGRNLRKLLSAMDGIADRRARFVCVVAVASPEGDIWTAVGHVSGNIIAAARGAGGFGYDPIFVPDGYTQTFAELPEELKNAMSHRAAALRAALDGGLFNRIPESD